MTIQGKSSFPAVIWYNIYTCFNCDILVTYSAITSLMMMCLSVKTMPQTQLFLRLPPLGSLCCTRATFAPHTVWQGCSFLQGSAQLCVPVQSEAATEQCVIELSRLFVQCSQPVPTPLETNLLFYEEGDDIGNLSEQLVICEGLAWDLMNLLMPHCFSRKMF